MILHVPRLELKQVSEVASREWDEAWMMARESPDADDFNLEACARCPQRGARAKDNRSSHNETIGRIFLNFAECLVLQKSDVMQTIAMIMS